MIAPIDVQGPTEQYTGSTRARGGAESSNFRMRAAAGELRAAGTEGGRAPAAPLPERYADNA